jgi:hypothetical protein
VKFVFNNQILKISDIAIATSSCIGFVTTSSVIPFCSFVSLRHSLQLKSCFAAEQLSWLANVV